MHRLTQTRRPSWRGGLLALTWVVMFAPPGLGKPPWLRKARVPEQQFVPAVAPQPDPAAQRAEEARARLALLADPMTFPYHVGARAGDGELKLSGFVPTEAVRRRAKEVVAQATTLRVVDEVQVHSGMGIAFPRRGATEVLFREAAGRLKKEFGERADRLTVTAREDGRVTVSGPMLSQEEQLAIAECLRGLTCCAAVVTQPGPPEGVPGGIVPVRAMAPAGPAVAPLPTSPPPAPRPATLSRPVTPYSPSQGPAPVSPPPPPPPDDEPGPSAAAGPPPTAPGCDSGDGTAQTGVVPVRWQEEPALPEEGPEQPARTRRGGQSGEPGGPPLPVPGPLPPAVIDAAVGPPPGGGPGAKGERDGQQGGRAPSATGPVPPLPDSEKEAVRPAGLATDHAAGRAVPPVAAGAERATAGPAAETRDGNAAPHARAAEQPGRTESIYQIALIHFLSSLAALVVGLALFSGCLVLVLRRLGVSLQFLPAGGRGEVGTQAVPGLEEIWGGEAGAKLELGPSYAEELRMKEEAQREEEQGVLRLLFEQNVRLREQIGELAAGGE